MEERKNGKFVSMNHVKHLSRCGEADNRGSVTHYSSSDSRDHTVNNDLALVRHIDNRPSHNMHSLIDGHCACDVRCATRSSQMFHVCLSRDRVHYPSMNMRNLRTFLSTDPLDLKQTTSGGG